MIRQPLLLLIKITILLTISFLVACGNSATNRSCAWTWSTGSGSSAVEHKVQQEFTTAAITGTVQTSSYGEINSCDGSYHAMGLDMNIEVQVTDNRDEARLAELADNIDAIIQKAMIVSTIPNKGRVSVRFVSAGNTAGCEWNFEKRQCRL